MQLQDTVSVIHLTERLAFVEFFPREVFFAYFLLSFEQNGFFDLLRNNDDTIEVRDDQVTWLHEYLATADRDVVRHHYAAPFRVKRPNTGVVNRKSHFDDFDAVANLAVTHAAYRTVSLRHSAHQLSPGRVGPAVVR